MVKTVSFVCLLSLIFSFFVPLKITKAEEGKWAVQISKERKGNSKLAIKSLAVKSNNDVIWFRCESWGNWNLGFNDNHIRVSINTEGKKNPGKKNTYQCDIVQVAPDMEEGIFLFLFLVNVETGEKQPTMSFIDYTKNEGILTFAISKSEIGLTGNQFSVLLEITSPTGGAIDSAPIDHSFVLYDPNKQGPDPYFYVDQTPIDLGQILQNQEKNGEIAVANWGEGSFETELSASIPQIKIEEKTITIGEYENTSVPFTIKTNDQKLGKHKEQISLKALEKEKTVLIFYEIMATPKIIVNPKELDFGSLVRTDKKTKMLTIKNENPGNLMGTIRTSATWIIISKESFDGNVIDVEVSISNLPKAGLLEAKISIYSNGGNLDIPVKALSLDIIRFSETELNFGEVDVDQPMKLQKSIKINRETKDKLILKIKPEDEWIQILPSTIDFTVYREETIDIELNFEILRKQAKTYKSSISIRSDLNVWTIPVTVKMIKFNPKLNWLKEESDPVSFKDKVITGRMVQINLVFQNSGTGQLKVETKFNQQNEWQANPTSLVISSGEKATVQVSINTTGLKNKIVSNVLQVTSNGGNVSIPLEVHVIDIPTIKIHLWIGKKTAFVNEEPIRLDEPPYIKQGSTMVPLRFIGEAFGAKVEWVAEGKGKIIIQLQNHKIRLAIGENIAYIDNEEFMLSVSPEIKNGRTFVPLRFISEGLGAKIDWYPENQEILITLTPTG